MYVIIKMPKLSPTMESGILTTWCAKLGDKITPGKIVAEIETDKAIMEVEATESGTLAYIAQIGKELPVNTIIACLLKDGETAPESWEKYIEELSGISNIQKSETIKSVDPSPQISNESILSTSSNKLEEKTLRIFASPLAKRIAQVKQIDLHTVTGSGPRGRIVKNDLENLNTSICTKKTNTTKTSHEIPFTTMRKVIAEKLTKAKNEIPHVYIQKTINMDALERVKENFIKTFDFKISLTPFFIRAIALALKENPAMNRSLENGKLMQHYSSHISVAVAIEGGLVTPVIRNAEQKNIKEIALELKNLSEKAKNGKLRLEEMQGGTFSISNLGMFGIDSFQAVINPPQAGILAIGGTKTEAHFENNVWVPKQVIKVTLSSDHRVLDGAESAMFLNSFAKFIECPEGMFYDF